MISKTQKKYFFKQDLKKDFKYFGFKRVFKILRKFYFINIFKLFKTDSFRPKLIYEHKLKFLK